MRRSILGTAALIAAFMVCGIAQAHNVGGSIEVGAGAGVYAGSVSGAASSISQGNAVAASQVNGYGSSFQHTDGVTVGQAVIGGTVNAGGASVMTGTQQLAQVNSYGSVSGNTPIQVGDSVYNGTGGLSKTDTAAYGNATFQTAGIGGFAGIGGNLNFGGF
jgi:hypothetical protein